MLHCSGTATIISVADSSTEIAAGHEAAPTVASTADVADNASGKHDGPVKLDSVSFVSYSDVGIAEIMPKLEPPTGVKHHAHQEQFAQDNCISL